MFLCYDNVQASQPLLKHYFLYAAGVLYEKTMSYKVPFILAGGAFVTSGLLSLFISRQHCAKLMKHADSSDTDSSQVTDTHWKGQLRRQGPSVTRTVLTLRVVIDTDLIARHVFTILIVSLCNAPFCVICVEETVRIRSTKSSDTILERQRSLRLITSVPIFRKWMRHFIGITTSRVFALTFGRVFALFHGRRSSDWRSQLL